MLCIICKYCDCVLEPKWSSHWKSAVPPSQQSPHISSDSSSPPAQGTGLEGQSSWGLKGKGLNSGDGSRITFSQTNSWWLQATSPRASKIQKSMFFFLFVNTYFKVTSFMREQFVGWFKFILTYYNIPSLLLHPSFIFSPYLIWCSVPFGCWPFWPFWNSAKQRVGDLAWPQKHANIQAIARLSIS